MPEKKKALLQCYTCANYRIISISESEIDNFNSKYSIRFINENTIIPEDTILILDINFDVLICPACGIDRI